MKAEDREFIHRFECQACGNKWVSDPPKDGKISCLKCRSRKVKDVVYRSFET